MVYVGIWRDGIRPDVGVVSLYVGVVMPQCRRGSCLASRHPSIKHGQGEPLKVINQSKSGVVHNYHYFYKGAKSIFFPESNSGTIIFYSTLKGMLPLASEPPPCKVRFVPL